MLPTWPVMQTIGRRIHHGRGDAGDHVGGARTGSRHGHAHAPAGARVAVGHVGCALLVPHQHVMNLAVLQRVIGRKNRPARIAEHVLHAFSFQAFPKDLRSRLHHVIHFLSIPTALIPA